MILWYTSIIIIDKLALKQNQKKYINKYKSTIKKELHTRNSIKCNVESYIENFNRDVL